MILTMNALRKHSDLFAFRYVPFQTSLSCAGQFVMVGLNLLPGEAADGKDQGLQIGKWVKLQFCFFCKQLQDSNKASVSKIQHYFAVHVFSSHFSHCPFCIDMILGLESSRYAGDTETGLLLFVCKFVIVCLCVHPSCTPSQNLFLHPSIRFQDPAQGPSPSSLQDYPLSFRSRYIAGVQCLC